jgi:hypothetical protein
MDSKQQEIQSFVSLCNKNQYMTITTGHPIGPHQWNTHLTKETIQRIISALHQWSSSISSREPVVVQHYKNVSEVHQSNIFTRFGYDDIRHYASSILYRYRQGPFYYQVHRIDTDTTVGASVEPISYETTYDLMVFRVHSQFTVELRSYPADSQSQPRYECIIHIDKPVAEWKWKGCLQAIEKVILT